ncbi:MAG TPA: hypothetical protein VFE47_24765 [Tepidisphaeraceae bacterium]|nr:hypothetical protein [Tepidisphaeraceae bacterium]
MGIDFLDIMFRLEKKLNVRVGRDDGPAPRTANIGETTAGQLADWFDKIRKKNFSGKARRVEQSLHCLNCAADLRGIPTHGFCRACGREISDEEYAWRIVREVLIDVLAVDEDEVHRDARLIKDLGTS